MRLMRVCGLLAALGLLAASASAGQPEGKFKWSTQSSEAKELLKQLQGRIESFQFGPENTEIAKKIVEADKVDDDARKFAASALNYLVSRMDLIPDWTDTIGVIDDVIVLRVCVTHKCPA